MGANKTFPERYQTTRGNPVAGASVLVKGSKSGTSTDASGSFTLKRPRFCDNIGYQLRWFCFQDVSIANSSSKLFCIVARKHISVPMWL